MTLRRALRRAGHGPGDAEAAARARILITLAWSTVYLHGRAQALELLDDVRSFAPTQRLLGLTHIQEAVVHVSCSDWQGAVSALDRIRDDFDLFTPREQVAALLNRGLAHLSLLDLAAARRDLGDALDLSRAHRLPEQEFKARHNLGCLEFYAGHLPEAIRLMREADELDATVQRARAKHDLALAMLEAGLLDQARATLQSALSEARHEGLLLDEGDIHLDLARCALLMGRPELGRAELDAAVTAFRSRGARQRLLSARLQRAAAQLEDGHLPRDLGRLLQPWLHDRPTTPEDRLATRVQAGAALLRGDLATAAVAVASLRTRAPQGLAGVMHDSLLRARLAAARGDRAGARRTVRQGLRRLTASQQPLQSIELRSALALHGRGLAEFDLADAIATASARRVFDSVERWRAVSHRVAPVSASLDAEGVRSLAQLRQARHLLSGSELDDDPERERLRAKVSRLEWEISQHDWAASAARSVIESTRPVTVNVAQELLARRDETAMVLFEHAGDHHLLQVSGDRVSSHPVGPSAELSALAERLNRDLRALAFAATNPALARAVRGAVTVSLRALDHLLFTTAAAPPARGVVVVPSAVLAGVPWNLLPSLAGRPVTVSPSMTRWATGTRPADGLRGATAVSALAGPGLVASAREVAEVAAAWQPAVRATSRRDATSVDVQEALGSSTLVHIAAHGRHENQSPFFSSLRMADGPVFAHELPRPVAAEHVVLSACEVGRSDLRPGDEPLGLTAALLALGATSVVAAVAPVRDEVASAAMVTYHRHLAAGRPAAAALAATVAEHPDAGAFCVFGSDWAATP